MTSKKRASATLENISKSADKRKKIDNEAISNLMDKKSEEKNSGDWQKIGSLLIKDFGYKPCTKIISFDLDGTLINTKSGGTFAKNKTDWVLFNDKVPQILKKYYDNGFQIVIFTNQAGISGGQVKAPDWKEKMENIQKALNLPILVIAACEKDENRKPSTGMWNHFLKNLNGSLKINLTESYYIGDAAGRVASKGQKKDFSDSDLKFAKNVGLKFNTPEEFFQSETQSKSEKKSVPETKAVLKFDPEKVPISGDILKGKKGTDGIVKSTQEVIIFVGPPAAGKSTFWKNYLPGYVRINQDTLKTKEKCMKVLENSLKEGKSCVIDNTNPKKETRKLYLDIAKEHKIPVRCFYFNVSKEQATHQDTQRKINTERQHLSKHVGRIAMAIYFKNFEMPEISEGFDEISEVNFIAKFENEKDKQMFNKFA